MAPGTCRAGPSTARSRRGWLNPRLAGHLERAKLVTLFDLGERLTAPARWWVQVAGVEEGKARTASAWLCRCLRLFSTTTMPPIEGCGALMALGLQMHWPAT
ncbi:phage integrase family protein [Variovorax ureilyticus]|uniref:phage integrase family protein n=1 Tax=Variovorax ureilyticus TaxID=1836198 RepID=UPI003BF4B464